MRWVLWCLNLYLFLQLRCARASEGGIPAEQQVRYHPDAPHIARSREVGPADDFWRHVHLQRKGHYNKQNKALKKIIRIITVQHNTQNIWNTKHCITSHHIMSHQITSHHVTSNHTKTYSEIFQQAAHLLIVRGKHRQKRAIPRTVHSCEASL